MNTEIIGSGALGMLFGARLAQAGNKVRLRTRTIEQVELIEKEGIHFIDLLGGTSDIRVTCSSSSTASKPDDTGWILLAVKQGAINESIYSLLSHIATPYTPVICLQNGIGHMEKLRGTFPEIPFLTAVTTEGARRTTQNSVIHTGKGSLWVEELPSQFEENVRLIDVRNRIISTLRHAGIDVEVSANIDIMVLKKLLVNCVINPLTAIYGIQNGQLPAEPQRRKLMRALFEETWSVLEAAHGRILGDQMYMWEYILKVCVDTASNESSMLADVRAHRTTEVRWINGGVSELANRTHTEAPLNNAMVAIVESLV